MGFQFELVLADSLYGESDGNFISVSKCKTRLVIRYRKIREISKPSTAQCNLENYTLFLLSEPKCGGCSRLAERLGKVSHDSVNRFLLRERYEPNSFKKSLSIFKQIGFTIFTVASCNYL
jgi:hypothetical protein